MRSIDIHAHLMPHCMLQVLYRGENWHGVSGERNAQGRLVYGLGGRRQALSPQFAWDTVQRLADMDSLGVDVQVVSTFIGYYQFPSDDQAIAACRAANDEVRQMARDYPDRFAGLCTLPMQNLQAAINEHERSVTHLGLKGAMLNDTVNGQTFDAPELLPFWQAAEQLGVSPARLRQLIAAGRLKAHKYGGTWIIYPRALLAVADRKPGRPRSSGTRRSR